MLPSMVSMTLLLNQLIHSQACILKLTMHAYMVNPTQVIQYLHNLYVTLL